MSKAARGSLLTVGIFFLLSGLISAQAQYSYTETSLITIIDDVQGKSPYRFLYRESMISDIRLSFQATPDQLFLVMSDRLSPHQIELRVDSTRQQVILFKKQSSTINREVTISGQVMDSVTGERLPFATVHWKENGRLKGLSSNSAGAFNISRSFSAPFVTLNASFVGYENKSITLDLSNRTSFQDISFRLEPELTDGNEVIVTGSNYYTPADSSLKDFVDIGTFSPLGESNTLRALQMLPSVSMGNMLSSELHVRGGGSDGLLVLLDDITIYNQSHLFGLLDSFNSDVLKTTGFFYDITPAQYQAPPGGTLSMLTKTGSLNNVDGSLGASNSTYRLTLEGPIIKGTSSWLLSGRSSYMNTLNWMNNSRLIEWGLNVNRPHKILTSDTGSTLTPLVRTGDSDARFYDLHGKLYFEGNNGNRLIFSGYFGGDNTRQSAERLYRSFSANNPGKLEFNTVTARNDWSNMAGSIQYQVPLSPGVFSSSVIGTSIYLNYLYKDDFTYARNDSDLQGFQIFIYPFENQSILNEIKADQQFDVNLPFLLWTFGGSYQYFLGEYFENSFDRISRLFHDTSHKVDAYTQVDFTRSRYLHLFAGTRMYYYSNGQYLKWSPRVKVKFFPESVLSLGAGYSKNHQFLNRITFSNTISTDVWVMSNARQPPTSVDYYSAGIYLAPHEALYFQVEGYIKKSENLRIHEIDTYSLTNTFNDAPWYFDNDGLGSGLEFLLNSQFNKIGLTQTFTVSRMEMRNALINNGNPFFASWDRTYRYVGVFNVTPFQNLELFLSWTYATGTPNKFMFLDSDSQKRLGSYQRTDVTLQYNQPLSFGKIDASFSLFNLFDRNNPWYRELDFVVNQSESPARFQSVKKEFYDLGFQPSFNVSVSF